MRDAAMARKQAPSRIQRGTARWAGGVYHSPRALVALVVALGGVATLAAAALHAATPVAPPTPLFLQQRAPSGPLAVSAATNRSTLTLAFRGGAGTSAAIPEVELALAGHPFSGAVSARGWPIPAGVSSRIVHIVLQGLRDGAAYHWRVRLRGRDGRVSRWVDFGAGVRGGAISFRVGLTPPPAPALSSPSNPNPALWYDTPFVDLTWPAPADSSGIAGYSYSLDRAVRSVPAPRLMTGRTELRLRIPTDGRWYAHVRALDGAGNWGAAATYALGVDTRQAVFSTVTFERRSFDPDIESVPIDVVLTNPASLRVQVFQQSTGLPVRTLIYPQVTRPMTVTWNGCDDAGHAVADGFYRFLLTATDADGQQSVADYSGIGVVRDRIEVSLSQQLMVVYDGTKALLTSLVTTGNKALPTPLGTYHIIAKLHPYTFISPWPVGSPYYYAPSPVQYALMFKWGGYFIHDAPWRSEFGPGSNARSGTPGQNTTGTHGCVNVPPSVAAWLYQWAPIGTVVQIVA